MGFFGWFGFAICDEINEPLHFIMNNSLFFNILGQ
jgi:hypothetical protein